MQSQIPDTLFNDVSLLREVVESANILGETIDFFTDAGGFTIEKGRIVCTLTDYNSITVEINLLTKVLTVQLTDSMTIASDPTSAAIAMETLSGRLAAAATALQALALALS